MPRINIPPTRSNLIRIKQELRFVNKQVGLELRPKK